MLRLQTLGGLRLDDGRPPQLSSRPKGLLLRTCVLGLPVEQDLVAELRPVGVQVPAELARPGQSR
jgi:hypothetical protein